MASNTTIPNDVLPSSPLIIVNLTNVIKLTNLNYLSWKLQIEAILVGHGLFKFLDDSHPAPPSTLTSENTTTPNPDYTTWVRQDKLLFGAFLDTLETNISPLVSRATTTKEAWDILAHTFARHTRGHAKLLKTNLRSITKGTQSITEYMNAIRICADQLAVLGEPCKPDDLIERVLEGIQDPAYQSVIDATNNRDTLISFDELHEKLLLKEVSLRNTTISSPLPISAHATTTRNSSSQSTTNSTNRKPFYQHHSTQSSKKTNITDKPSGNGYKGRCQWCHTHGHSLYRCPSFNQRFPDAKPTLPPQHTTSPSPQAHVATATTTNNSPSWLLDTGASHHVTHDLSTLSLHHPYDGAEEIVIGPNHGGTSPQGTSQTGNL